MPRIERVHESPDTAAAPLLAVEDVDVSFGTRRVLNGVRVQVESDARIGVVGPNGAGKSTLLRVIAGQLKPNHGAVTSRRGLRTALLVQDVARTELTGWERAMANAPEIMQREGELARIERQLTQPGLSLDRMSRLLDEQARLYAEEGSAGGEQLRGRIRAQLRELEIELELFDRPLGELSGGERRLVDLAIALAQEPDVLLLDEPEAHVDIDRRQTVERAIHLCDGAVVVVSHDRRLLDDTVRDVVALDHVGRAKRYPGNYSAYALQRELDALRQLHRHEVQLREIRRLEESIARFLVWAKASSSKRHKTQAESRVKRIEKMDRVERPLLERRRIALSLRASQRGGDRVVALEGVTAGFDDELVLHDVSVAVDRGERVGIVGPNGAGKTVLTRLMAGTLEPLQGRRWIGPSISVGVLAQHADPALDGATPLEVARRASGGDDTAAMTLLARFLFDRDQALRRLDTLSGGERRRLALLDLMVRSPNLLLLDEPTNHIDTDAIEVLEAALERYDGTLVAVSHDRYFLERLVDRVIEVRDGGLVDHLDAVRAVQWSAA